MNGTNNPQANLPANIPFHQAMKASHPSVLSNVANTSKQFFRYTIDIIERAIKSILGKDTTGPSSIQKAIPIRTRKATNMLNNASLILDDNKNLRAHRASLTEMLDMYPDATAVSLFTVNDSFTRNTKRAISKEISQDAKDKCSVWDQHSDDNHITFNNADDITDIVGYMIHQTQRQKQDEFRNNKEIKIILETPPFIVPEQNGVFTAQDCAQAYITACEAWQLHLQMKYDKKVTILPFRSPENTNNKKCAQFTENNNNAYDNANAALAKINKQNRENEILTYVNIIKSNDCIPAYEEDASLSQSELYVDLDLDDQQNDIDAQSITSLHKINGIDSDIIHTNHASSSTTGVSNQEIKAKDTVRILTNHLRHTEDLDDCIFRTEANLEELKKSDKLSDTPTNFNELQNNTVKESISSRINNTSINADLTVRCHNAEFISRKQDEIPIMLSDISKEGFPLEDKDKFFIGLINKPVVSATSEDHLKYKWTLYLSDFENDTKFSTTHEHAPSAPSALQVMLYLNILRENLFNRAALGSYIEDKTQDLPHHNIDTTNPDSTCNLDMEIDLIIPKSFVVALEKSKYYAISELVQTYGAVSVILNSLRNR